MLTAIASADFTAFRGHGWVWADQAYALTDVYAGFSSGDHVLLEVLEVDAAHSAGVAWHHDVFAGGSWSPYLASDAAGSYVSIGGFRGGPSATSGRTRSPTGVAPASCTTPSRQMPAGTPTILPAFTARRTTSRASAWALIGASLIGRWVIELPSSPVSPSLTGGVTLDTGIGTPEKQVTSAMTAVFVPAPAAPAPLGVAGLVAQAGRPGRQRRPPAPE